MPALPGCGRRVPPSSVLRRPSSVLCPPPSVLRSWTGSYETHCHLRQSKTLSPGHREVDRPHSTECQADDTGCDCRNTSLRTCLRVHVFGGKHHVRPDRI